MRYPSGMNPTNKARLPQTDFLKDGNEAFLAGRFNLAASFFEKAHRAEPRDPVPLFNLASAKERVGDLGEAAAHLTRALKLKPDWADAAQRLCALAARYVLPSPSQLDPHGLLAAFAFDTIDQEPVAATAIAYLRATTMLGGAVRQAEIGNADEAARALILRRTDKTLTHPLLHAALARGINRDPDVEALLVALRRVILMELQPQRFEDKTLLGFACTLLQQCFNNGHVFAFSAAEDARLKASAIDWDALTTGSVEAAKRLLWQLLYRAPEDVIAGRLTSQDCRKLRPRVFAEVLVTRLREDEDLAARAARLPVLSAAADAVSRRVGRQYQAYPYPRWTSLSIPAPGSGRRRLERFFSPERLTFFDEPFKVLIAGAGTGRQAVASAFRYGDKADVLAVDLSRPSLAYGEMKAEKFGAANVRFGEADLLGLKAGAGLYDMIEAVGVLHHLGDPFAGLRALSSLLRPGGLMLVGLYSEVARRNIANLKSGSDYPGADCDDDAARAYRAKLMRRKDDPLLLQSHDFYALADFRDLVLHPQEASTTLAEIEAQLRKCGLIFRGFLLPPTVEAQFTAANPEDAWPGSLQNWRRFEEGNPRTFDAMYQFWCEKSA